MKEERCLNIEEMSDKERWEACTREGHERWQLRYCRALTGAEKVAWLEESQRMMNFMRRTKPNHRREGSE